MRKIRWLLNSTEAHCKGDRSHFAHPCRSQLYTGVHPHIRLISGVYDEPLQVARNVTT